MRRGAPPSDAALYALDSGNPRDSPCRGLWDGVAVNIDHHHDNPRYGELAFVRGDASSTSELVCDIARALGLLPSPAAAGASTRASRSTPATSTTTARRRRRSAHAAWLVELGVDVTGSVRTALRTALARPHCACGRAPSTAPSPSPVAARSSRPRVTLADFAATGAGPEETEGIVDSLRGVDGVEVAAVVKEQDGRRTRARQPALGIHRRQRARRPVGAAEAIALPQGSPATTAPEEVIAWLSSELERRLSTASS